MHRLLAIASVLSTALSAQPPGNDPDQLAQLQREIASLKQGQKRMEKSLSAMMDILTGKKPPLEDVFVNVSGGPSLGQADAKVTIVEFTDFQCPFCSAYARETLGRIVTDYVKTGKARYVVRNFPLEQAHPLARKAAEAALCALEQGKYWELHDRFFADQRKLAISDILQHADAIGANIDELRSCLEGGGHAAEIAGDLAEGRDLGVLGTPTFFVGSIDPGNKSRMRAVRSISGNVPYRAFEKVIAEVLDASKPNAGGEQ